MWYKLSLEVWYLESMFCQSINSSRCKHDADTQGGDELRDIYEDTLKLSFPGKITASEGFFTHTSNRSPIMNISQP